MLNADATKALETLRGRESSASNCQMATSLTLRTTMQWKTIQFVSYLSDINSNIGLGRKVFRHRYFTAVVNQSGWLMRLQLHDIDPVIASFTAEINATA